MAYFQAFEQFDINGVNLNWYNANLDDSGLDDNSYVAVDGQVYEDLFYVDGYDGYNWLELVFLGSGISQDLTGAVVAGTVNFVAEFDLFTNSSLWYVQGISISALNIYNAALTVSNQDEIAIIQTALAGDDTIVLSPFDDRMYGFDGNDDIYGNGGNDTIDGGKGDDNITGGAGNDTVNGGDGWDEAWYDDAAAGVIVNLATGTARSALGDVAGIGIDNLISIEDATGSAFADNMTGNALGNFLDGNAGDDWISGGGGADWLFGQDGNDQIFGGGGDDQLEGEDGADQLDGGAGNDRLDGGEGSDVYLVSASTDHATAELQDTGSSGSDEVRFSATGMAQTLILRAGDTGIERVVIGTGTGSIASTSGLLAHNVDARAVLNGLDIIGNSGANTLYATAFNDDLSGRGGIDRLYGYDGNDTLDGGTGGDLMRGGLGDDTYYVDNVGDRPIENANEGTDSVFSSISFSLASNVENLTITGSAVRATGNASDNWLVGNKGANILNGGAGADVMRGGLGNDTYYVGEAGDTVVEASGAGRDRVYTTVEFTLGANVEDLFLRGSDPLSATGNGLDNVLRGNSAANVLTGGAGADDLRGGAGADAFVFDDGDFGGLTPSTSDRIIDFSHAEGDAIDLTGVDANSLLADHQAFDFIGTDAFSNVAGQLRFEQVNDNTYVYGDIDGDGIADLMIRMDGSQSLVVGDFIL